MTAAKMKGREEKEKPHMVIGIDLGMTVSAWCTMKVVRELGGDWTKGGWRIFWATLTITCFLPRDIISALALAH